MKSQTERTRSRETTVAPAASPIAAGAEEPVSPDEIARRAYALFEGRGGVDGHDADDWLDAERQLKQERARARGIALTTG